LSEASTDPEVLAEQAFKEYKSGNFDRAAQRFTAAHDQFLASGNKLRAAEMSNNLCVCLLEMDQASEALAVVRETPITFHKEGNQLLKAQALGNRAMAKTAMGQMAEAEADYRAAAELFRDLGHKEGLQYTMQALSKIQLQQGRTMEALNAMQSVLDSKSKPSIKERFLSWLFKLPMRFLGR
jgi:tetratricopeptide (TPR) repeat protein